MLNDNDIRDLHLTLTHFTKTSFRDREWLLQITGEGRADVRSGRLANVLHNQNPILQWKAAPDTNQSRADVFSSPPHPTELFEHCS